MTNSCKKLPDPITSEDRISNFPDQVLCRILSFLEIKQAVATSSVSKRWKFLWTYVDFVEFVFRCYSPDDEGVMIRNSKSQFEKNVNKVLQLHRGLMKRMRLVWYGRVKNEHRIAKWIQTAISMKIETLDLCLGDISNHWRLCLFHSQTLVELKLEYADITNISICTAPFFPNLKKLHLYQPYCTNDSLNRFISGCPTLEYFNLDDGYRYNDYIVREVWYISSATLKTVSFCCSMSCSDSPMMVLNTPALEVLKVRNCPYLEELLVESSMPSLHKADFSFRLSDSDDNSSSDPSLRFLEFLSNVSTLCCEVQDCFYRRRMNKLNFHAHFNNLTRLEIIDRQFALDLLRIFIEKSNNLKAITLKKGFLLKKRGVIWEEPQQVPECLLSSLQSVRIYGYHYTYENEQEQEQEQEQEEEEEEEVNLMIKYILGNAKVLKGLEIRQSYSVTSEHKFRLHMLRKLSMFPKASEICEILIN